MRLSNSSALKACFGIGGLAAFAALVAVTMVAGCGNHDSSPSAPSAPIADKSQTGPTPLDGPIIYTPVEAITTPDVMDGADTTSGSVTVVSDPSPAPTPTPNPGASPRAVPTYSPAPGFSNLIGQLYQVSNLPTYLPTPNPPANPTPSDKIAMETMDLTTIANFSYSTDGGQTYSTWPFQGVPLPKATSGTGGLTIPLSIKVNITGFFANNTKKRQAVALVVFDPNDPKRFFSSTFVVVNKPSASAPASTKPGP